MADCELRRSCPFYQNRMDNLPGTAGMYRKKCCHGDRQQCARYYLYAEAGADAVPDDMLPYHHRRAHQILGEQVTRTASR